MRLYIVHILLCMIVVASSKHMRNKKMTKDTNRKRDTIAVLPNQIGSLMMDSIKTGTHFEMLGCVFEVAKDDCKTTFLPKQSTCQEMTLPKMFEYFYKDYTIRNITRDFIPMRILQVDRFILDRCINEVDIETTAKESFEIIKGKLKVLNSKVITSFIDKEIAKYGSFESLAIELTGSVVLGKINAPFTLDKKRESVEGQFMIRVEDITAASFSKVFSSKALVDSKSPVRAHTFTNANIKEPSISGNIGIDGSFEVILKGQVIGIAGLGRFSLFVIAQKPRNGPTGVAVVADINNIQPTNILSTLTGKNLDNIPILREVITNVVLEFANEDMIILKDNAINMVLGKYIAGDKTVSKGTKLKLQLPADKILQRVKEPKLIFLQIYLSEGSAIFNFPSNNLMDLASLTRTLIPKVPPALFLKVFRNPPGVQVFQFTIDVTTKAVHLKCSAPEELIMGKDLMAVRNAEFQISHSENDTAWKFEMKARKKIAGTYMDVILEKKSDKYKFLGKINSITMKQLANNFGAKHVADPTIGTIHFLNFVLTDVVIDAEFNDEMKLHFLGTPRFFDYDGSKFEGFVLDTNNTRKMIFGIILNNLQVDEFVEKCYQKHVYDAKWFNQLTATLLISSTNDAKEVVFVTPELKNRQLIKIGVTFYSSILIPEDCKGEEMCMVAREKMMVGTKLFMEGEMTRSTFNMRAPYRGNGVEFGKNFILKQAMFVIEVDDTSEFSLVGSMKANELLFQGKVTVGVTGGIELMLELGSAWTTPFGLRFVSFGDVQMLTRVQAGTHLPRLFLSSSIHVGKSVSAKFDSNKDILANATISYHPANNGDNHFYGKMRHILMANFARAFEWDVLMSKAVEDARFPDGLSFGFTTNTRSGNRIPHLNVDIKALPGLSFYGKISILSMLLPCEILVTMNGVKLTAALAPMFIDHGMIYLQQSSVERENGAKLIINLSSIGFVIQIKAYAQLLGVSTDVIVNVDDHGFKFYFYGHLFNLIEANTTAYASYVVGNFVTASFEVSSCFASDIADVTAETANTIMEAGDETSKALKESGDRIEDAVYLYNEAHGKTAKWSTKLTEYQLAVEQRSEELDQVTDFIETSCVELCKKVCVGGPSINEHWRKMSGRWVSCPEWEPCKRKIHDVICLASCKGKKVYKEVEATKKKSVTEILLNSMDTINLILDQSNEFVERTKDLINSTVVAAQQVQNVTAAGKQAMAAVANFTKANIIDIHNICFDMPLSKAVTRYFSLTVDATLGRRRRLALDVEAMLDSTYVRNIGEAIAEQLFPGLSSVKGNIRKAMYLFDDVLRRKEDLQKFVKDSEEKEKMLQLKVETPVEEQPSEDSMDRRAVQTEEITRNPEYIRNQLYSKPPTITIQDDLTLDAFEYDSPWSFSQDDSPFTQFKSASKQDTKDVAVPEIYIYPESTEDPDDPNKCIKTRGLLSNYGIVSQTVGALLQKLKLEKDQFALEARDMIEKITQVEKSIIHNCKRHNIGEERTADALFFVYKLKNGTAKWVRNVEQQIATQDGESLRMWRKSFSDIVKTDKQMDLQKFLENLKLASDAAGQRHSQPTKQPMKTMIASSLDSATKLIGDLLAGEEGSLSSKTESIDRLHDDVAFLRKEIPCAAA